LGNPKEESEFFKKIRDHSRSLAVKNKVFTVFRKIRIKILVVDTGTLDLVYYIMRLLGRSQVGKARDFDSRMRWFESSRPSHFVSKKICFGKFKKPRWSSFIS
jgi:hypothetical protein